MSRTIRECLVCGSRESTLLVPSTYHEGAGQAHRYFLALRETSAHGDIRRCTVCGFVFTSPQFDPAEYDAIYARVDRNDSAAAAAGPGAAATRKRFSRLKQRVAGHVEIGGPFLDFGCGDGDFLREAGSASALGFEIGPPAERAGPAGTTIVSGRWDQVAGSSRLPFGSQRFVTAFDVFEHLACLDRDLALIRRVLEKRGHLFVTVPDIGSAMARAAGARWNMFLLEHLWYFNAQTLDRLLGRHGFEPRGHSSVPYDAAVSHVVTRTAQSIGRRGSLRLPHWLQSLVLPVPAGVLFAAYRKTD
jgi:SAM-dependent methyltransferase